MAETPTLQIKDWQIWQSYRRDRGQPPWIKVHRRLMRNLKWVELSDAQKGQLVSMWMLAADHNGAIPSSHLAIQKLCHLDAPPDLNLFIEKGFLDAKATSKRRQHDAPDKIREDKKERAPRGAISLNGKGAEPSPEAECYRKAKELLGASSGGMVKKLISAKGLEFTETIVALAASKGDPRAYIGAVLRDLEPKSGGFIR
jgi:hypothetical protein